MDEGLLLHIDDSPTVKRPKLKGKKTINPKKRLAPAIPVSDERIAKKRKKDTPSAPEQPAPKSGQVISSLFTYNPVVSAPSKPVSISGAPSKPTNAPLDASTFSGLGLNNLLVNHLKSKLNIKAPTSIQRTSLSVLLSAEHQTRDAFIQSQTGSGKTLSYLLPIVQDLLPLSSLSYIDRSIGTLAIIIAPTRELAKQIYDVLEVLLQLRLRESESTESGGQRLTRFLVGGLLIGGATRTHEKARLRKGLPILVCTPGRLLDHLQNTSSFNVGKCRWLVLDEADRLLELGFEESIKGILSNLEGRRNLAIQALKEGITAMDVGGWDWDRRRKTILCSATLKDNVQKLAGTTLDDPIMIKAFETTPSQEVSDAVQAPPSSSEEQFTLPPAQLQQRYIIAPLKLRLVALVALLRTVLSKGSRKGGAKVIVFFSCTDSVDFHLQLLGRVQLGTEPEPTTSNSSDDEEAPPKNKGKGQQDETSTSSPLLPNTTIYKLHGSLPTAARLSSLKSFSQSSSKDNQILFATSVASRGLDLPLVQCVIQYDLPTEGGFDEYVHRVGRTARAGKGGESWCFVAPSEVAWVDMVLKAAKGKDKEGKGMKLIQQVVEKVLEDGFGGGKGQSYQDRATEVQLAFERWVLRPENTHLARNTFHSYVKAYATHPSNEKHIFHTKNLHLGHLAKSFGLRETPTSVGMSKPGSKKVRKLPRAMARGGTTSRPTASVRTTRLSAGSGEDGDSDIEPARGGAIEKRMQAIVRAQGKLSKKDGTMMSSGLDEYHIGSSGYEI